MRRNLPLPFVILFFSASTSTWASTETQQHTVPGGGATLASIGDVDHDGVVDFALGASGGGVAAFVFSGRFGEPLFTLPDLGSIGAPPIAAAGDVNGDGTPDIAVGFEASATQSAAVFSGSDGSLLLAIPNPAPGSADDFGHRVVGIGDVNGDGRSDLVVTAPLAKVAMQPDGIARVFSGATGNPIFVLAPKLHGFQFGVSASDLGDVNADGTPDFLVGSLAEVDVVSGKTGMPIRVHQGLAADQFGFAVAGLADATFDGVPDVAIGMPNWGPNHGGRVAVFSGKNGSPINDVGGAPASHFGSSLAAMPHSANGLTNLLIGQPGDGVSPGAQLGLVSMWEVGTNFTPISTGAFPANMLGTAVASLGDVDGDGAFDALVSERISDASGTHFVARVMSSADLGLVPDHFDVSLSAGGTQTLSIDGFKIVPDLEDLPPDQIAPFRPYAILGSASGTTPGLSLGHFHLPLDLDAYFLFTASNLGGGLFVNGAGLLDADGLATAKFVLPPIAAPAAVGLVLHHAVIVFDGPGLQTPVRGVSNAAPLHLVP